LKLIRGRRAHFRDAQNDHDEEKRHMADRLIGWFEAARMAGCHTMERPPPDDATAGELREYMRANWRFQKARQDGRVPQAHKRPGTKSQQWWHDRLHRELQSDSTPGETRGRGRPPKKKPDSRSSANQANAKAPRLKEAGSKSLHQKKRDVNANDAVRHG
jgi:hypothetical protein